MSIRVTVLGLGAMGGGIANLLLKKDGFQIVAAGEGLLTKHGKDLGEVLDMDRKIGVTVTSIKEAVKVPADIVLQATGSFTEELFPDIMMIIESGKNLLSIAEELAYPTAGAPDLAEKIDRAAKTNNITVLGTGINPGFVLDALIMTLTGVCTDVQAIKAKRINDLSPFGTTVMKTQGVGTTVEEFRAGIKQGTIVGHIGFKESASMIADGLGWKLDEIKETREPIVSSVERETPYVKVGKGMVAGCKHCCYGVRDGKTVLTMEHPQQIHPHLEGIETGDYIQIEGTPSVNMAITPEIPGGIGTIALAVNMIPHVLNAPAGLVSMKDLPIPRFIG